MQIRITLYGFPRKKYLLNGNELYAGIIRISSTFLQMNQIKIMFSRKKDTSLIKKIVAHLENMNWDGSYCINNETFRQKAPYH